jgi:hypothetical protein
MAFVITESIELLKIGENSGKYIKDKEPRNQRYDMLPKASPALNRETKRCPSLGE